MKIGDYKEGDICPICDNGKLEYRPADDPNSVYPNGGWDEGLACNKCDYFLEKEEDK